MRRRPSLGGRISELLDAKRWNQTQLAREMGTSQQHVSDWVRNKVRPNTNNLAKLADVLGVPREELMDLALVASEEAAAQAARERDRISGNMKIFAKQYEEFHGEYRRIAEDVAWLVETVKDQTATLKRLEEALLDEEAATPPRRTRRKPRPPA